jgi:hypothetical protein
MGQGARSDRGKKVRVHLRKGFTWSSSSSIKLSGMVGWVVGRGSRVLRMEFGV